MLKCMYEFILCNEYICSHFLAYFIVFSTIGNGPAVSTSLPSLPSAITPTPSTTCRWGVVQFALVLISDGM